MTQLQYNVQFFWRLLGILADDVTFYDHITSLCSKANLKRSALAVVSKFMTI